MTWDPGTENFLLAMSDTASGSSVAKWTYSATVTSTTATEEMSAEWVVEAPADEFGVLPLADFGTASFTGCSAEISGATGPINAFTDDAMTMVTERGVVKAQPPGLTDGGTGFTVKWEHD